MRLLLCLWVFLLFLTSCDIKPDVYPSQEEEMKSEAESIFLIENQAGFVVRETCFMLGTEFPRNPSSSDEIKYKTCGATIDSLALKRGILSMTFDDTQQCGLGNFSRHGVLTIKSHNNQLHQWEKEGESFEVELNDFGIKLNGEKIITIDGTLKFKNNTARSITSNLTKATIFQLRGELQIKQVKRQTQKVSYFRKVLFKRQTNASNQVSSWFEVVGDTLWRGKNVFSVVEENNTKRIATLEDTLKFNFCSLLWKKTDGSCSYYEPEKTDSPLFRMAFGLNASGNPSRHPCMSNRFSVRWMTERGQDKTLLIENKD